MYRGDISSILEVGKVGNLSNKKCKTKDFIMLYSHTRSKHTSQEMKHSLFSDTNSTHKFSTLQQSLALLWLVSLLV